VSDAPSRLDRRLRVAAIAGLAGLLAASALTLWLALPGRGPIPATLAVIAALPLLLPVPGLVRGRRPIGVWGLFLLAPYLALGLTEVVANPPARASATAVIGLVFVTSIVLIAWLRVSRAQPER